MVTIDARFKYDGLWRRVSNITFEAATQTLIGFEMRRNGKFSYKIKRYTLSKITDIDFIMPMLRQGPTLSIPE